MEHKPSYQRSIKLFIMLIKHLNPDLCAVRSVMKQSQKFKLRDLVYNPSITTLRVAAKIDIPIEI